MKAKEISTEKETSPFLSDEQAAQDTSEEPSFNSSIKRNWFHIGTFLPSFVFWGVLLALMFEYRNATHTSSFTGYFIALAVCYIINVIVSFLTTFSYLNNACTSSRKVLGIYSFHCFSELFPRLCKSNEESQPKHHYRSSVLPLLHSPLSRDHCQEREWSR